MISCNRPTKFHSFFRRSWRISALAAFVVISFAGAAQAELNLSIFTGFALTRDNDLDLHLRGGTHLTFHDVSFEGRDFETPPFYGARMLWFPGQNSHWGFGAEFFHIKLYAQTEETVRVTGQRSGFVVDGNERVDQTIQQFSISHGLNFALADVVFRWFPGPRGPGFSGCFQPYAGLGIGAAIPHVESEVGGAFHEEYQFHGPGVQGLIGVNIDLTRHWGVMFEYKLSYANLGALDIPDGSIEVTPLTHNLVAGITLRF